MAAGGYSKALKVGHQYYNVSEAGDGMEHGIMIVDDLALKEASLFRFCLVGFPLVKIKKSCFSSILQLFYLLQHSKCWCKTTKNRLNCHSILNAVFCVQQVVAGLSASQRAWERVSLHNLLQIINNQTLHI